MKIVLLILLTSCTLLKAEYPRYKIRGPPHPPRVPPSKQFAKKWHQQSQYPPRNPVRSRPIPVHMPPSHKIPLGVPQAPPRAVAPPVRAFWKNTQASTKFQPEKAYIRQEKPFLAAPSINAQEFDYHIQTNSIPTTHNNPIKQVGEKGPIHTIPAPNLSLKDKPIVVEEVRYQHQHNAPYINVEPHHQYQVTEQPESSPKQKVYRPQHQLIQQQQIHQQQLQSQQQQLQLQQLQQQQQLQQELQKQIEIQPQQMYYTTDPVALSQALPLPTQKVNQGEIYLSSQLDPKDLYQIIGTAYPQLQPQVQGQEAQKTQAFYQPQQLQNYQALLAQQLFQPEQSFVQHLQPVESTQVATDKIGFQPELQSFNYDEQAHRKSQQSLTKKDLSSLVSAAYNLDSNVAASEPITVRNSLDPLAQAQLIQNYFDTRSDVEENGVEPDAKPSVEQRNQPEKIKELLGSSFYSSLPNKEAAERLADLQAAGKVNSNLMKLASSGQQAKDPKTIFVPDEYESDERGGNAKGESNENYSESSKELPLEYEDYSQEEDDNGASEEQNEGYGHRMQENKKRN